MSFVEGSQVSTQNEGHQEGVRLTVPKIVSAVEAPVVLSGLQKTVQKMDFLLPPPGVEKKQLLSLT